MTFVTFQETEPRITSPGQAWDLVGKLFGSQRLPELPGRAVMGSLAFLAGAVDAVCCTKYRCPLSF